MTPKLRKTRAPKKLPSPPIGSSVIHDENDEPQLSNCSGPQPSCEAMRHDGQGCGLVDLTDTLSVRPGFLCHTCEVIVRADHDECIDLARTLEKQPPTFE